MDDTAYFCQECGWSIPLREGLPPGTVIAGFRIVREIGRGAMGVVYLARQVNLDRCVAIKVLSDESASDEAFVESFFREARLAASLSHPNIVQAFDAGVTENGIYYFVMELIEGEDLDTILMREGPLDIEDALDVLIVVADALGYAWSKSTLSHGDIKPANIIVREDGDIKLADFGLARRYREMTEDGVTCMGTPAYAAPEVIRGGQEKDVLGFKSDMYSFGATAFHMLIGHEPFQDSDPGRVCEMQLNEQPPPVIALRPGVPARLSALIDSLMEKLPRKRPMTWETVVRELKAIRDAEYPFRSRKDGLMKVKMKRRDMPMGQYPRRKAFPTGCVVSAIVAVALAGGLAYYFREPLLEQYNKRFGTGGTETTEREVKETGPVALPGLIAMPEEREQVEVVKTKKETYGERWNSLLKEARSGFEPTGTEAELSKRIADAEALLADLLSADKTEQPESYTAAAREDVAAFLDRAKARMEKLKKERETKEAAETAQAALKTEYQNLIESLPNARTSEQKRDEIASNVKAFLEKIKGAKDFAAERRTCQRALSFLLTDKRSLFDLVKQNSDLLIGEKLFPRRYPDNLFNGIRPSMKQGIVLTVGVFDAKDTIVVTWNRAEAAEGKANVVMALVSSNKFQYFSADAQEFLYIKAVMSKADMKTVDRIFKARSKVPAARQTLNQSTAELFKKPGESDETENAAQETEDSDWGFDKIDSDDASDLFYEDDEETPKKKSSPKKSSSSRSKKSRDAWGDEELLD